MPGAMAGSWTGAVLLTTLIVGATATPSIAQDEGWDADLADLDLEALMEIPVTSVAGVAQPLRDTPAAIHVITGEDIRRGGHLTIADALRQVPGVQVAQVSSNIWAISARGFNDRFSTKLLVMVDGRAVYNSLFSGVFWDAQDMMLEDVDRVEVIRGPGATLWGANAVNGVINVVSKRARRTQGLLVTGGGGNEEQGFGGIRYGGRLGEDTYYRVYTKSFNRDHYEFEAGGVAPDDWDMFRGGFRLDFESDPDTMLTIQGDAYDGTVGQSIVERTLAPPFTNRLRLDTKARGHNLLARVEHFESADAGWTLQAYYDHAERHRGGFFDDDRDTFDVEFRHYFAAGESHDLIWGVGYRHREDETNGSFTFSFDPPDGQPDKFSAFVQDTITLVPDELSLMIGSKFEHNDHTGFEVQPSARMAWRIDERRTMWGAFSRAVRTPSRGVDALQLTTAVVPPPVVPTPTPVRLVGNPDADAEELYAFELGYRFRPTDTVTVDVAGFYNDYDRLVSIGAETGDPFTRTFSNATTGESYGVEVGARWDVAENWRLAASYSFLTLNLHGLDEGDEGTSPQNQAGLRSYLDLTGDLELNAALYYVDTVSASSAPSYWRADVGLTWRPAPNVEIAVWGQNLLDPAHLEFTDPFFVVDPIEVERSVYAQLRVRF